MPKGRKKRVEDTKTVTFGSGTPIEIGKAAPEIPQQGPAPATDDQFQSTVLGLLQQLTGAVAKLDQRVDAVEQQNQPQFRPAQQETFGNEPDAVQRYQLAEMAPLDGVPRSQTVPVTSDGLRVPEILLEENPARFGSGSRVRLNLDAVPHGRVDGKTRGQLMMEADVPNAPGVVIDKTFLSRVRRPDGRRGVWKYRCQFPSAVMPGSTRGVVTLHEPELLPA